MFSFFTFLAAGGINPEQIVPGINKTPISALTDITSGTSSIVGWLITIFWIVAVGFIIWSAFLYLGAGGDEERLTKAKAYLKYAIIAAVVATLAIGIQAIVINLLTGEESSQGGGEMCGVPPMEIFCPAPMHCNRVTNLCES
jgi:hypothetical protein